MSTKDDTTDGAESFARTGMKENPETHQAAGFGPNVRIPPFWRADPELWFCQAEAVFATSKVLSSRIKFQMVVANLEFEVLKQISDIVKQPPDNPYEALRDRLTGVYAESENLRIRRLLEDRKISEGERPSQFLRELRRLAGSTFSPDLLRSMWLRALPERMQATLAVTTEQDLDKLAAIADRIAEVYEPSVCEFSQATSAKPTPTSSSSDRTSALEEAISELTLEIASLRGQLNDRKRQRPRSRSRSRGKRFCFYHDRFKEKAHKCRQPCDWQPPQNSGRNQEN